MTACAPGASDGEFYGTTLSEVDLPDLHGPSILDPTSEGLAGQGCAYTPQRYGDDASGILEVHYGTLSGELGTLSEVREALAGGDEIAELTALRLSVALNQAGVFGSYAQLGEAFLTEGKHAGVPARSMVALAAVDSDALESVRLLNEGFAGCPPDWFTTSGSDVDGDGVPNGVDCDDGDDRVGALIHEDDFSTNAYFTPTAQLGDDWHWDGDSVIATEGGQEAMLGADAHLDDIVVFAELTGDGAKASCGFDCEESCGAYEPDDCYTTWQALGLGILTSEVSAWGQVTFYNSGAFDVCMDPWTMWDSPAGGQGSTLGSEDVASYGGDYRVPAGGSLTSSYGSWTTDNGYYSPFLGQLPFWCVERGTYMVVGNSLETNGSVTPEDIQGIIAGTSDLDGDGVEDHVDWTSSAGVQAQHNIWDYQATHAAVMIGKLAASTGSGTVETSVHVENRGAVATTAIITDTLPRDWSLVACSDSPDSVTTVGDTTELTWEVVLSGCTSDCAIVDSVDITCELEYLLNIDMDIVELPAATASYFDGTDDESSTSLPGVAFDYDADANGTVACGTTDRWRGGVLARATLDGDQDEGYHGYRCALARNSPEDCFDEGYFVQIGAFLDGPEDAISSECESGCPPNTTFDQLARTDHADWFDISTGVDAQLQFWAVGDQLVCDVYDGLAGTSVVSTSATSNLFAEGAVGLSTLNLFGDFEHMRVCEAHGTP